MDYLSIAIMGKTESTWGKAHVLTIKTDLSGGKQRQKKKKRNLAVILLFFPGSVSLLYSQFHNPALPNSEGRKGNEEAKSKPVCSV